MYLHVGVQAWKMEHWRGIEEMSKKHKNLSKRCICRQMNSTCRQMHTVIPRQNSGLHLWVYLSTDAMYLSTDTHRQPRTELRFSIPECICRQMQTACRQIHSETHFPETQFSAWVCLSTDASAPVDSRRKLQILGFQIRPHLGVSFLHDPHLYLTLYKHPFGAKFAESSLPSKSLQGTKRKSPKLLLCFNFPPRSTWNHHLCGAEAGSSSIQPSTSINLHPIEVWRAFGRSTRRIPTGFVP